ncbi:hypothetical protein PV-S19_0205 [Pacmanvirus S19]|nr:hypothetical protein PV-S19_0205 [Pacmanvirus S19]
MNKLTIILNSLRGSECGVMLNEICPVVLCVSVGLAIYGVTWTGLFFLIHLVLGLEGITPALLVSFMAVIPSLMLPIMFVIGISSAIYKIYKITLSTVKKLIIDLSQPEINDIELSQPETNL